MDKEKELKEVLTEVKCMDRGKHALGYYPSTSMVRLFTRLSG